MSIRRAAPGADMVWSVQAVAIRADEGAERGDTAARWASTRRAAMRPRFMDKPSRRSASTVPMTRTFVATDVPPGPAVGGV